MARTKATACKEGFGPGLAAKATCRSTVRKGKPVHILKQKRVRRISQKVNALREIRAAQKSTELCIPKLPIQRVIREICENWGLAYRWKTSGLLCLQEAAEGFLIELFNDVVVLAAHAKRITVMVQDVHTLKRVRWRYDKLLHPYEIIDERMREILMIPPARAPKQSVIIEDVTHDVNTRAKVQAVERRRLEDKHTKGAERRDVENKKALQIYMEETESINKENNKELKKVSRGLFVYVDFESGQKQLELPVGDVKILLAKEALITDTIMYICQTLIKHNLPNNSHHEVFIVNSQISNLMSDPRTSHSVYTAWFTFCDPTEVTVLVLPYEHSVHWSLAIIEG